MAISYKIIFIKTHGSVLAAKKSRKKKMRAHTDVLFIKTHGSVLAAKKSRKKKTRVHTGVLFTRPVE